MNQKRVITSKERVNSTWVLAVVKIYIDDLLSLNVPTQGDEILLESESKTGDLIPEER